MKGNLMAIGRNRKNNSDVPENSDFSEVNSDVSPELNPELSEDEQLLSELEGFDTDLIFPETNSPEDSPESTNTNEIEGIDSVTLAEDEQFLADNDFDDEIDESDESDETNADETSEEEPEPEYEIPANTNEWPVFNEQSIDMGVNAWFTTILDLRKLIESLKKNEDSFSDAKLFRFATSEEDRPEVFSDEAIKALVAEYEKVELALKTAKQSVIDKVSELIGASSEKLTPEEVEEKKEEKTKLTAKAKSAHEFIVNFGKPNVSEDRKDELEKILSISIPGTRASRGTRSTNTDGDSSSSTGKTQRAHFSSLVIKHPTLPGGQIASKKTVTQILPWLKTIFNDQSISSQDVLSAWMKVSGDKVKWRECPDGEWR